MPRRLLISLLFLAAATGLAATLPPQGRPQPSVAFSCGDTNSKLQIFVSGPGASDYLWAFYVTPNPFDLGGSLRVVSDGIYDSGGGRDDILMEDVCTTTTNEQYTVAVDTASVPCPLTPQTQSKVGPLPVPQSGDPYTVAFYFTTNCPTPTPTQTPTPTSTPVPTATPIPTATPNPQATPTPTATPSAPVLVTVSVVPNSPTPGEPTPSQIPCGGTALVNVTATQAGLPVADGTTVSLVSTLGTLAQPTGITVAGRFTTVLTLPDLQQVQVGTVTAAAAGQGAGTLFGSGQFSAAACEDEVMGVSVQAPPPPVQGTVVQIRPPSTGGAGLR